MFRTVREIIYNPLGVDVGNQTTATLALRFVVDWCLGLCVSLF